MKIGFCCNEHAMVKIIGVWNCNLQEESNPNQTKKTPILIFFFKYN